MTSTNKSRFLFKNDTVENWQAQEDIFQTLKGELYFYKDAIDTGKINHEGKKIYKQRLKIGNDVNKINELVFWRNPHILNSEIDDLFKDTSSTTNLLNSAILDSLILG